MGLCSIFEGYYVLNVYKGFGQTVPALRDDSYLTTVGMVAAVLNTIRFVWSSSYDIKGMTFKQIYGLLLVL